MQTVSVSAAIASVVESCRHSAAATATGSFARFGDRIAEQEMA
jgi:hypothetical protein